MNRNEHGYSLIKVLIWLVVFGSVAWQGFNVLHIYQINWRVEDVFTSICRNMTTASEMEIRQRLPTLLKIQFVSREDVSEEFYDNLIIKSEEGQVEISSSYHVTLWPLGPVENVDEDGSYAPDELEGVDILRDKIRLDFKFEPYAATP